MTVDELIALLGRCKNRYAPVVLRDRYGVIRPVGRGRDGTRRPTKKDQKTGRFELKEEY